MSSSQNNLALLKSPSRKRTREPGDDIHSAKRRRSSISLGALMRTDLSIADDSNAVQTDSSRDRFLPTLTTAEPFYHLNETSPRSARLARALGLLQPRLLSFRDDNPPPFITHRLSDPTLPMRAHLSQSLAIEKLAPTSTHSAAKHGKLKPDRVLDSGPMDDFTLHPCAWSSKDMIAAVIRGSVFTHNMETNSVLSLADYADAACVEWTSDTTLAVGYEWGAICLFDAGTRRLQKYLIPGVSTGTSVGEPESKINAMCWSKEQGVLAVGRSRGEVSYFDPRTGKEVRIDRGNASHPVLGVKWSPDGLILASGHEGGIVRCMDWKANKTFELKVSHGKKAHKGSVKALAWAPWNPRLLATGNQTVRIWSVSGPDTSTMSPGPLHALPFSSSVSSLHFTPHTTELLSTHGAFSPATSSTQPKHSHSRRRSMSYTASSLSAAVPRLPTTRHALLVHSYPSLQRMHTIPDAHGGPIVDSVLAPDGTRVMTFGEDETLRIFTIWGARKEEKKFGVMERHGIR